MDSEIAKGKPLRREETKVLLDLIESSKILLNKTTNATSNKLKIKEWHRITHIFNATVAIHRRTPQQLRLKWENLKKIARKRSTKIIMSQVKTGGGQLDYVPPNDLLDRVAGLLASTASGFTVPYGGDKETTAIDESTNDFVVMSDVETLESKVFLTPSALPSPPPFGDGVNSGASNSTGDVSNHPFFESGTPSTSRTESTDMIRRFTFNKPRTVKKKDEHRSSRNLAIAEYFNTKKKYLEESFVKIKLENENLALKNSLLQMEIEKLKVKEKDEHRSSRNLAIAEYFNTKKKCLEESFVKIKLENENLALKNSLLPMEIEKLKGSRHCSPDQRGGGD